MHQLNIVSYINEKKPLQIKANLIKQLNGFSNVSILSK